MESILKACSAFSDWAWGAPLTILLLGTGVFSTIITRGSFFYRWKFHFKNTYGKMFDKADGVGTVSSFAAACTAMANTIGTGNIAGVSTAIAAGGPGAVVWMWITGLLGCSTKACEIILGQRYRVKFKNVDEYVCDRSFALKNAFHLKWLPLILAILTSLAAPWTCLVQTEAVTSACQEAFHINKVIILVLIGVTCSLVIFGGLRRISSIMEKVVPLMAGIYILGVLTIMVTHASQILPTFALIVKCAFTPAAAVGGFAGATVREAMRFGVARGLYSNDAGAGYGMIAHSPAKTDHPVRQASWGWGEVFFDTIVICTMSALAILMTGVYYNRPGISQSSYVTAAFSSAFGGIGAGFAALSVTVFAWTTIIGMYYASENTFKYLIGDNKYTRLGCYLYMVYFIVPVVVFSDFDAALLWSASDMLAIFYIIVSCLLIILKGKEINRLFNDFTDRYLPALKRGEHPEPVSYETNYSSQSLLQ
ncbi:MAG: amino acid carrier protein [Oscillibacter sp.]|jgi:AGCS family alanine or glycine:cation symporter|nr:amino acid carrier protein [Oscillibacter sp.]